MSSAPTPALTKSSDIAVTVHPTAIVHPKANLGQGVAIGPYCVIGPNVALGDRVQLQQVIINLLINAIQAMAGVNGRARELLVRSSLNEADSVVVAVRDSGEGLDPAKADQIFDAFYSTKADGMGMGLSICRTIMDAHNGRLWASANDGAGATFQFSLPAMGES